uniref:Uncharacterized protein n=1 Tax=Rhizophora mucronata TaxID=61149 RepID=A0A2P2PL88_RHIMU
MFITIIRMYTHLMPSICWEIELMRTLIYLSFISFFVFTPFFLVLHCFITCMCQSTWHFIPCPELPLSCMN